jgi:hypothetical protein
MTEPKTIWDGFNPGSLMATANYIGQMRRAHILAFDEQPELGCFDPWAIATGNNCAEILFAAVDECLLEQN